jgi:hypothetical protein
MTAPTAEMDRHMERLASPTKGTLNLPKDEFGESPGAA